jgi:hypothetical protein
MSENYDKYQITHYTVNSILSFIESNIIAIPEIQRPFVWRAKQVRDLIDSLYNGYPTGYLIIWQNPEVKLKNGGSAVGKKVLIDGQQRVTALMTAIAGKSVLNDDFEEVKIKIAFNPIATDDSSRFEVQTAIHLRTKHWIPDISILFSGDTSIFRFINQYIAANPGVNEEYVAEEINKVINIKNSLLGSIELVPKLDIKEVTEIFVRINSQGKRLNESDFVMSKIASDEKYGGNMLRKAIDYFCHLSANPNFYAFVSSKDKSFMDSEFESKIRWLKDENENLFDPDYNDVLRVAYMHQFGRGKLSDLVSLLSGRDFDDRIFKESIAEESFASLKKGILNVVHEFNFKDFLVAIRSAGFINPKLLNSQLTLDFAYTLYLMLKDSDQIPKVQIKKYIQKWFVFSTITSRYIGSPETQFERDLREIKEKGFIQFLKDNEEANLSDTFWEVRLVKDLETSSTTSPFFNVYTAAQVYFNENSLLSSSSKVTDLVLIMGDIHHIFPKGYLKDNKITEKTLYNQVANYAYLDTTANISIGKKAPNLYFKAAFDQCTTKAMSIGTIDELEKLQQNLKQNCIPDTIVDFNASNYEAFLIQRRKLMADKIKTYYLSL